MKTIKKNNISVICYTKEEFIQYQTKKGAKVIGSTSFKEYKSGTPLVMERKYQLNSYIGDEKYFYRLENGEFVAISNDSFATLFIVLMVLLFTVAIIMVVILGVRNASITDDVSSNKAEIQIDSNQDDWDGNLTLSASEESPLEENEAEIVGFTTLYATKESPMVTLPNPSTNNCYFLYTVTYNDEVVYESDCIAPGKMVEWNAYKTFKTPGTYDLVITVITAEADKTLNNVSYDSLTSIIIQ